jgi:hypothetical protein
MGLLVACFNFARAPEDEFHDWYDLEHVPQRVALPGFINAQRWLGAEDPKVSVVTYDLDSLAVLQTPAYLAVSGQNLSPWSRRIIGMCERIGRFDAEQILPGQERSPDDAPGMLLIAMNVRPEADEEFNAWYDEEHVPRLKAVPGVLSARRFRTVVGSRQYIALYHLTAPEVQATPAWKEAITTPWQAKMKPQTSDRLRVVLKRYTRQGRVKA